MKVSRLGRWVLRRAESFAVPVAILLVAVAVLAGFAADRNAAASSKPEAIKISARPVPFDRSNPERRTFGQLQWRGGLRLSSGYSAFGGYSGLALGDDGKTMLVISDRGSWFSARLEYDKGMLTGLSDSRAAPIPQKDGKPIRKKWHRDAEALVPLDGGGLEGRYFIGFEGFHRLDEYRFEEGSFRGPIRRGNLPNNLRRMPNNQGLEGVTSIRGGPYAGGLVLFAERKLDRNGDHTGSLVFEGDAYPLSLKRHAQFDITGLETLSDGSLLVLERSFIRSRLKLDIRLRLVPAEEIKPGAKLNGKLLMEAGQRLTIDNFEGLAVTERDDETLITLISDDNFNFFQSTLLVQFALERSR